MICICDWFEFLIFIYAIISFPMCILMIVKTISMARKNSIADEKFFSLTYPNEEFNIYGVFKSNGYDKKFKLSPIMVVSGVIIFITGILLCLGVECYAYDIISELNLTIIFINCISFGVMTFLFPLYMYPTRVARRYEHNQTTVIALINFLFAYTILGWILLLAWANSAASKSSASMVSQVQVTPISNAEEIKKFKELFDSGIISQEEYDVKKRQLLGL